MDKDHGGSVLPGGYELYKPASRGPDVSPYSWSCHAADGTYKYYGIVKVRRYIVVQLG
jgi:hypothetical protein